MKSIENEKKEIATKVLLSLRDVGAIKFGEFKLKSDRISPYYLQLRELSSYQGGKGQEILKRVAEGFWWLICNEFGGADKTIGVAYAGIPLSVSLTMEYGLPSCFTRKETKQHGIKGSLVEGELLEGEKIVIVDDVITTGDSKLEAIRDIETEAKMRGIKLNIAGIVCMFDREEGGRQFLEQRNYKVSTLIPVRWAVQVLASKGLIGYSQRDKVLEYLKQYYPKDS